MARFALLCVLIVSACVGLTGAQLRDSRAADKKAGLIASPQEKQKGTFSVDLSKDGKTVCIFFREAIPEGYACFLEPKEARAVAACLTKLADEAEGKRTQTKEPPIVEEKTRPTCCPCGVGCECDPCKCGPGPKKKTP
jgi:hypothetical protein